MRRRQIPLLIVARFPIQIAALYLGPAKPGRGDRRDFPKRVAISPPLSVPMTNPIGAGTKTRHFTLSLDDCRLTRRAPRLRTPVLARLRNPSQPGLAPVRRNRARTKQSTTADKAATDDPIEYDAIVAHPDHLARLLVDYLLDPTQHAILAAALRQHLDVEPKTAILLIRA